MAIEDFVAGPYTGTWNAVPLGVQLDGFSLEVNHHADELKQSDIYGQSLMDTIHLGATYYISFESLAYGGTYANNTTIGATNPGAGSLGAFWPWGKFGTISTPANPIGMLGSNMAKSLVLTALANTSASTSPATLTAAKSILTPGSQKLLFSSKLRTVPVKLALLPQDFGDNNGAYSFQLT